MLQFFRVSGASLIHW